jgi:cyclophilin family peptidyl-prolyl cis-trans isomerase
VGIEETATVPEEEGDLVAVISTNEGDIVVRLLPELAPRTVAKFVELADSGFYMRTTFHYVSPGFIQGGDPFSKDNDPLNDGLGNAREWIEPEFHEEYPVQRGTVGMMRKDSDPNSSSCQFFIVLKRKSEWDGRYNIFGEVLEGIEVAETISNAPRVRNNPKLADRPAGKQLIRRIEIERRKLDDSLEDSTEVVS